jgi:hypothetical protein
LFRVLSRLLMATEKMRGRTTRKRLKSSVRLFASYAAASVCSIAEISLSD